MNSSNKYTGPQQMSWLPPIDYVENRKIIFKIYLIGFSRIFEATRIGTSNRLLIVLSMTERKVGEFYKFNVICYINKKFTNILTCYGHPDIPHNSCHYCLNFQYHLFTYSILF